MVFLHLLYRRGWGKSWFYHQEEKAAQPPLWGMSALHSRDQHTDLFAGPDPVWLGDISCACAVLSWANSLLCLNVARDFRSVFLQRALLFHIGVLAPSQPDGYLWQCSVLCTHALCQLHIHYKFLWKCQDNLTLWVNKSWPNDRAQHDWAGSRAGSGRLGRMWCLWSAGLISCCNWALWLFLLS